MEPFESIYLLGYFFPAKLSATRCSAMEATGETCVRAPLGHGAPDIGDGGLGLGPKVPRS
jgi:hypothetical protein